MGGAGAALEQSVATLEMKSQRTEVGLVQKITNHNRCFGICECYLASLYVVDSDAHRHGRWFYALREDGLGLGDNRWMAK